jgi:hypothetical protein
MKSFIIEYRVNHVTIDEVVIKATNQKEANEKLRLHNKDNPMKYSMLGEFIRHT